MTDDSDGSDDSIDSGLGVGKDDDVVARENDVVAGVDD